MAKKDSAKRKRPRKRQPKKEDTTKLKRTVGVRLTEAEHTKLAQDAAGNNKSKAEVLRAAWRGKPLPPGAPRLPARLMNEWEQLPYHEWTGVGNGLLQFLRLTHVQQTDRGRASEMLDEIKDALERFRAFIAREEIELNDDDLLLLDVDADGDELADLLPL